MMINCTGETFTSGHSGAIGTWVHQLALAGQQASWPPLVVTRDSPHESAHYDRVQRIEYPAVPSARILNRATGAWTKLLGFTHKRQATWNRRLLDWLDLENSGNAILLFHNDPELAVEAKRRFPHAFVACLFHVQNHCARRFREQLSSIDLVLGVSDYTCGWAERYFGLQKGSAITLYPGVQLDRFAPGTKLQEPPLINYLGLINHGKGVDLLLTASQRLASKGISHRLQLIGGTIYGSDADDTYTLSLKRQALELERLGVRVDFLGYLARAEVPAALAQAHINVVPTRRDEAFGLAALEGLASGCATVAARVGGLPEAAGPYSEMFAPGDGDALALALERLLTDPELLRSRQENGRRWAEGFTWASTWAALLNALPADLSAQSGEN